MFLGRRLSSRTGRRRGEGEFWGRGEGESGFYFGHVWPSVRESRRHQINECRAPWRGQHEGYELGHPRHMSLSSSVYVENGKVPRMTCGHANIYRWTGQWRTIQKTGAQLWAVKKKKAKTLTPWKPKTIKSFKAGMFILHSQCQACSRKSENKCQVKKARIHSWGKECFLEKYKLWKWTQEVDENKNFRLILCII